VVSTKLGKAKELAKSIPHSRMVRSDTQACLCNASKSSHSGCRPSRFMFSSGQTVVPLVPLSPI
jgi:hypothetical protein